MKKRIISLVLVGVLTLSILGGCGKRFLWKRVQQKVQMN